MKLWAVRICFRASSLVHGVFSNSIVYDVFQSQCYDSSFKKTATFFFNPHPLAKLSLRMESVVQLRAFNGDRYVTVVIGT